MKIKFIKKCVWRFTTPVKIVNGRGSHLKETLMHYEKDDVKEDIDDVSAKSMVDAGYAEEVSAETSGVREVETKDIVHKKKNRSKKSE